VIFFSCLNELLSSAQKQSFEITLIHKKKNNIYVLLECRAEPSTSKSIDTIHLSLTEITDSRLAAAQMQAQQDLLGLIFTITNNISTVSKEHLVPSIEDALKKICLFTKADRCFVYGINRPLFRLDPVCEWRQPSASLPEVKVKSISVPLSKIKQTMTKLHQEKTIIVQDTAKLKPDERNELLDWHRFEIGAIICHVIYLEKLPIGIIGVAKNSAIDKWEPHCAELVKFFGDFIADRLPFSANHYKKADKPQLIPAWTEKPKKKLHTYATENGDDDSDKHPGREEKSKRMATESTEPTNRAPTENSQIVLDTSQSILLEKFSGDQAAEKQPVFERGDSLVLLTCPHCGIQESVSDEQFDKLGNPISATCPCTKQFVAVLEQRQFFRKLAHLPGYFSLSKDLESIEANGSTWGMMVVKNISKAGLQFSSRKANLLQPGDLLMVRFNLDNANQPLIHKPARVISVTNNDVGCKFEGADSYDITLGFYFM
jgi:hypothetical protein